MRCRDTPAPEQCAPRPCTVVCPLPARPLRRISSPPLMGQGTRGKERRGRRREANNARRAASEANSYCRPQGINLFQRKRCCAIVPGLRVARHSRTAKCFEEALRDHQWTRGAKSGFPVSARESGFLASCATADRSTAFRVSLLNRCQMTNNKKSPESLRSARWFAPDDLRAFGHRSRAMQMGYAPEEWKGRPIIAIVNTWSDVQPCHMHFKSRVDDVKRGVLMAGGFPVELPALSLSESLQKPTTMLYRNLLAMDAEELLRGHPVDGVVLMGGCDKTTPALLLGATSMNLPASYLPAGPMLRGNWKGKTLGSGSDAWKYWDERRAGKISDKDWVDVEGGIARSSGTCVTMGTASTMTAIAEAVGMTLPGASSIPAADAGHIRMASECGRRIVEMVWEDLTPGEIQSRKAFGE